MGNSIRFTFNRDKAVQAILWLLNKCNGRMDKWKLFKLFLYADIEHLRKYGRPIAGEHYVAMEYGPVPSEIYDLVKESTFGLLPFKAEGRYDVVSQGEPNEMYFSDSDLKVLTETLITYGKFSGSTLSKMSHKLDLYIKNEPPKGGQNTINYEDFFDGADEQAKKMLNVVKDYNDACSVF